MPRDRTKEEILARAAAEIAREAAKDRDEVGDVCEVWNIFDEHGAQVAYRVILRTDNGLEMTFPDVAATKPPENVHEITEAHRGVIGEIKRRRNERRARSK